MTLKEAKKILNKEGFSLEGPGKPGVVSEYFKEYESPEVCEAMQVVCSAGYMIMMFGNVFEARKDRLRKEYEKNTKAPGSAENRIKEDSGVNPALKESASQFNDALLDEQAKKIEKLTEENERLKDQVAVIYACKENNEKYNLKQIKRLGKEIAKLNGIIHDKNEEIKRKTKGCCELVAENVDLKEGLRKTESLLQDVREANSRNLDTCFKNEDLADELKEKLAEKTKLAKKYAKELSDSSLGLCKLEKQLEDKNAVLADVAEELRLSKIREKNLTEVGQKYMKENEELRKKLADKVVDEINAKALKSSESTLAYKEKVIAEKDEVIADLGKELAAQKGLKDEISLKYIGVKRILKLRRDECEKLKKELEAFKESYKRRIKEDSEHFEHIQKICNAGLQKWLIESEYLEKDKPFRFPQLPDFSEEEEKKLSLFRDDSVGAVTNQKDCSPVKDTHPTVDIAEEGGDHSAIIARCCKNIAISRDEAEIIERCTKNGTELHYSEKDGFTYTNIFGDEIPIICLRGMCQVFTDEEIKNMKK